MWSLAVKIYSINIQEAKPEAYSKPSQTSKLELFAKTVNGFKPLTIFAKSSTLHVHMDSEYASEKDSNFNLIHIRVHRQKCF